jgi:hypothetical protein
MEWYHYVSGFFAGAFLANFVPHFVKGVCGDFFPSPFAKPPGKGPSSPIVNVLWALVNLIIAYVLYRVGKVSLQDTLSTGVFFSGISAMGLILAKTFVSKEKM